MKEITRYIFGLIILIFFITLGTTLIKNQINKIELFANYSDNISIFVAIAIGLIMMWFLFKPTRKNLDEEWKKLEGLSKKELLKLLFKKYEKKDKREIMNEIIGRAGVISSR